MVILAAKLSLKIVKFIFIVSLDLVDVLIVLDFEQFELVVLFLLELGNSFLLVAQLLHVLVLVYVFLVAHLLDVVGKLPVLRLQLAHLRLQVFVLAGDSNLGWPHGSLSIVGPAEFGTSVVGCVFASVEVSPVGSGGQLGYLGWRVLSPVHH
jgi:hypothetical protein